MVEISSRAILFGRHQTASGNGPAAFVYGGDAPFS